MLLVARPAAVLLSFVGHRHPAPQQLFIAWFGPKGVASMLFALLVPSRRRRTRRSCSTSPSFVILASIIAHGLTDTVGRNGSRAGMRAHWQEEPGPPEEVPGKILG